MSRRKGDPYLPSRTDKIDKNILTQGGDKNKEVGKSSLAELQVRDRILIKLYLNWIVLFHKKYIALIGKYK